MAEEAYEMLARTHTQIEGKRKWELVPMGAMDVRVLVELAAMLFENRTDADDLLAIARVRATNAFMDMENR